MRRRVVLVLVGPLVLGFGWGAVLAQASGAEVAEQQQALERAKELAEAAEDDPSEAEMERIRAAMERPAAVRLGRAVVELPPDPVLTELSGGSPEDLRDARERLDLLARELEAAAASEPIAGEELAAALEDAYREVQARPTVAQRLWRFAEDLLTRFVEALAGAGRGVGVAAAVALSLLGAAGLWLLGRRLFVVADEHAPAAPTKRERPADWRREAEAALAAGDLDRAVRAEYRLLVHHLARRGLIRDTPRLTPGEARRAVSRAAPDVAEPVREATGVFERVAYGEVPPDREDVERMRTAVEGVAR